MDRIEQPLNKQNLPALPLPLPLPLSIVSPIITSTQRNSIPGLNTTATNGATTTAPSI